MGFGLKKLAKWGTGAALGFFTGGPAGAAGALGSLFSASQNAKLSDKQMEFQERMRNTQYQAAADDMRLAGINPMLAGSMGGNASPSGSMAHVDNPVESGAAVSSAAAARKLTQAQIESVNAATDKTRADTEGVELQNYMLRNESVWSADSAKFRRDKLDLEAQRAGFDTGTSREEYRSASLTADQQEKMMPLLLEAQRLENAYVAAGLTRAQAEEKMYRDHPWLRSLEKAKELIGGSVGSHLTNITRSPTRH